MIALILCAGYGTRLQPLTDDTPKGLLKVGEGPIIDHLIRQIADWPNLEAIHLLANEDEVGDYFRWWQTSWNRALKSRGLGFHLHGNNVRKEDEQRGAVGDLAYLCQRIGRFESALVTSGDNIYRFPLQPACRQFQEHERNLALALRQPDAEKLRTSSVLQLDDETDTVAGVAHEVSDPPSEWISPAFYFLKRTALQRLDNYLEGDGDPDTLGRFIDHVARHDEVRAARVPSPIYEDIVPDDLTEDRLRFHINTREDFKHANSVLEEEPLMSQS